MPVLEFRLQPPAQPLTGDWQRLPIAPRSSALLGISFRPLQAEAFGLDPPAALRDLLAYPFQVIRLGAYWKRIEPQPGAFQTAELDRQIDAAEQAGKRIILCVGPLKTFGYPEFFVPAHRLPRPFPERRLVRPSAYPDLLSAAAEHITRLVERYRGRESILAWQVEHEAVDPLGVEHSWRLAAAWVEQEARALRAADPTRPVLMNGFLPSTLPVRLNQGWQTRDQGDSLAVAQRIADWVGVDDYPRNALARIGSRTLYLDGSQSRRARQRRADLLRWAQAQAQGEGKPHPRRLLVTEGQAEPWETATTPPSPAGKAAYSCMPEHLIENYNAWFSGQPAAPFAYLFWGAEYWLLREKEGDGSYLGAFKRIVEEGG